MAATSTIGSDFTLRGAFDALVLHLLSFLLMDRFDRNVHSVIPHELLVFLAQEFQYYQRRLSLRFKVEPERDLRT